MPKIAIVAGEASGDLLGSHLIQALKAHYPAYAKTPHSSLEFIGIAGPKMIGEGAISLYPMERLSVRGYVEVLRHLFGLLRLRKNLLKTLLADPPDLFIGIDAPDFNFWLERQLKAKGIPTIHYASPSIWAWRKGRMSKIKRAVSHMLALFPFEPKLYEVAGVPVTYVGHPLADILPLQPNKLAARESLKLKTDKIIIAMLPGSRLSEVQQHADLFVKTAILITKRNSNVQFLVPLISRETRDIFEHALFNNHAFNNHDLNSVSHDNTVDGQQQQENSTLDENIDLHIDHENINQTNVDSSNSELNHAKQLPLHILFGHAHDAMEAADAVIVASGTATLEAALLKCPMVITYRMPNISWQIMKRMNYLPYVGLPNILAGKFLVPELMQHDATPEKLAEATLNLLGDPEYIEEIKDEFMRIHLSLKQNTAEKAAKAVLAYLK